LIGRFARWDFNLHDIAGQRPIRIRAAKSMPADFMKPIVMP